MHNLRNVCTRVKKNFINNHKYNLILIMLWTVDVRIIKLQNKKPEN